MMKEKLSKLKMPAKPMAKKDAEMDLEMLDTPDHGDEPESTDESDMEMKGGQEPGPLDDVSDDDLIAEMKKRGIDPEMLKQDDTAPSDDHPEEADSEYK